MSTTDYSESFWLSEYGKRQPFIPFCKSRVHLKLIHLYPNSPNPIALSSITESQWYPVNFLELKIWFMSQSFFLGEKLSKRKNMINNTFSLAELSPHCSSTVVLVTKHLYCLSKSLFVCLSCILRHISASPTFIWSLMPVRIFGLRKSWRLNHDRRAFQK